MAQAKIKEPPLPEWIKDLNKGHFVCQYGSKTVVFREEFDHDLGRETLIASTLNDFYAFYMDSIVETTNKDGNPVNMELGRAWAKSKHRRKYEGLVFDPSTNKREIDGYYNLWRGFAVTPKQGEWPWMRLHIRNIICRENDEYYEYLLNYLAFMVQKPEEPAEVALVLKGGEGTGKGILLRQFVTIFGRHAMHLSNSKHLVGNFNAHLRDSLVVFADEAFFAGDKKHESILKAAITEPTTVIEAKFQDAVTVRNRMTLLMASNDKWVVPAGVDARRFFVLDIDPSCINDRTYFSAISDEMNNGGREAMFYDLLERDIKGFRPSDFPRTEALIDQQIRSFAGFNRWWCDCLISGEIQYQGESGLVREEINGSLSTDNLYSAYVTASKINHYERTLARTIFGKEISAVSGGKTRRADSTGRRRGHYCFGTLEAARKMFTEHIKIDIPWKDLDSEEEGPS